MLEPSCSLCSQILSCNNHAFDRMIHEFEHSYLVLEPHQYYPGYSLLVAKEHIREPHELTGTSRLHIFEELLQSAQAIQQAFNPWKLNYACYGNQVPHLHWHIIPRYERDPDLKECPFKNSADFKLQPADSWIMPIQSIQKALKNAAS